MNAIIEEGAKFAENVLAPLNQSGDEEGCVWSEDGVKTPEGFAAAYGKYVENGWPALSASVEDGGQGMPNMVGLSMTEMALAWVLREANLASAIIGASRPERVVENAGASGLQLDADTLAAIDTALAGCFAR